ncbi:hypothetical protein CISG_01212 [Coccidioides immitis RMSCC 3703]|uniref:Sucrase/ferredoxin domain-containing protein n=1 Tax=Coccidioides immitis RMSCC 3703 TaxID=454286 RepID=A0A0J8QUB1_COCIT|nr:hypothetical protein CISG_01212 [Coccidioides immitis RMSCC 3703]
MASIFRRGLEYLSPSASRTPSSVSDYEATSVPATGKPAVASKVITAQSPSTLFTVVDPTVDGEDCDHDCASCTIKYPAKFSVDYEDELYGHVKGWATHVLVAREDRLGSVMEAIERGGVSAKNGALKLSASNIPVPDEYYHHPEGEQPTTVLLLPAFTIIDHVTPALVPNLIRQFVDLFSDNYNSFIAGQEEPTEQTPSDINIPERPPLDLKDLSESLPTSLRSRPCSHAAVILLCSQKTRDARCGQSAPLLRREFERHLRPLGLYRDLHDERPGGVGIYFISHVGGHKYSANVIVYRRRNFEWFKEGKDDCSNNVESMEKEGASQGIWLARVRPEDCEGIVKFTVLQGKVVKPGLQLRGGFDREKGLISW